MNPKRFSTAAIAIGASLTLQLSAVPEGSHEPGTAAPVEESDHLADHDTADKLWQHIQELEKAPTAIPGIPHDEVLSLYKTWQGRREAAAEAFAARHPEDPRRWDAKLIAAGAAVAATKFDKNPEPDKAAYDRSIEEVLAAPDASAKAKGEARYLKAMSEALAKNPANPFPDVARASADFINGHPDHPRALESAQRIANIVDAFPFPGGEELLAEIAKSPNAAIAEVVEKRTAEREARQQLRSEPIHLSFTATDGEEIDLAKLRGKVVLLDFWASWCGPCIREMPHVVKAYEEFHEQGFEVLGISLDTNKKAMEAAVEKLDMAWPQYFEGDASSNRIAIQFDITAIPATWLIDKSGRVRETGLRGEALGEAVKKLLAEKTPDPATEVAADVAERPSAEERKERFMRVVEGEESIKLQTAVTHFGKDGTSVDLIADIHMADEAFFEGLKERLSTYDAVLFEMIGGEKAQPGSDDPQPSGMYGNAAGTLGLSAGKGIVDHQAANMVHADLTAEEFNRLLEERGESMVDVLRKAVRGDSSPERAAQRAELAQLAGKGDPAAVKRFLLKSFGEPGSMLGNFSGASVMIEERNQRCIEVLKREMAAGHGKIAIVYGASHHPDMEERLLAMGFQRTGQGWQTAWSVPGKGE